MRRLFLAMVLPALACSTGDLPACPNGTMLNNGACRPQCAGDEECTLSEECRDGVCVAYVGVSDAGIIDVGMISCTKDQDCPNGPSGPWSDCMFDDPCDMSGRRSRTVRRGSCTQGLCGIAEMTQPMACPRDTNGQICGPPETGPWGPCENPNDECDPNGLMRRMVGTPTCNEGRCELSGTTEELGCMRATDGLSCGPGTIYSMWSSCTFSDVCASNGERYRTVDTFTCTSGFCGSASEQEVDRQTCIRPPVLDGTPCSNDAHCCSGFCTQRSDPQNCNACGMVCPSGVCAPIIAGDGSPQWACECGELADCRGYYGPSSDCIGINGTGVCVCQCPAGDCTGECAGGTCHTPPGLSYCGY